MENQRTTLGSIINPTSEQQQGQVGELNRNSALVFYTLTMNLRFPHLDLNNIQRNEARRIAEASIGCTRSFDEVWNEVIERQTGVVRGQRAA